ncbi:MAG TPA: hypothetical protein VGR70_06985 [Stellaceae bacterium]|nr:hypothetical protein [Stellaceae bacterium]
MVGLYSGAPQENLGLAAQGTEAIPATSGQVLGASFRAGLAQAFPSWEISRAESEGNIPMDAGEAVGQALAPPRTDLIDPDTLNQRYGIEGRLKFTAPLTENAAADIYDRKRAEIVREDVINRREPSLLTGGLARLGAGLAGGLPGLVDPLNIASAFIPVLPEARTAAWIARAGESTLARAGTRAGIGAIQGAAGQLALTPLQYVLSKNDQEDFTASDALFNIALGGVMGAGLHVAFGGVGDVLGHADRPQIAALDQADPDIREALLRSSVAAIADDKPVDVDGLWRDLRDAYEQPLEGSNANPYETIPREPQRLTEFLRSLGGVQDQGGELGDMLGGRQRPGLINRTGLPLDEATYRAWEAGFLPGTERPDINTLLEHVDRDLRGNAVYSSQDLGYAALRENAMARNVEIDQIAQTYGVNPAGRSREDFWNAVADRASQDELTREIAERDSAAQDAFAEAETRAQQWAASRGDAWEPDFETGAPRSLEDLENEHRQREAATAATDRPAGDLNARSAEPDQGDLQEGIGQRGRGARPRPGGDIEAEHQGSGAELDPLAHPEEDIAGLERELAALPDGERPAELDQINQELADSEAFARACEQSGACLGRQL